MDDFKEIPSTGGKYSINRAGQVKNVKTGRLMKVPINHWIALSYDGDIHYRNINQLLEEVHGIPEPPRHYGCKPVRVVVRKGEALHYFRTLTLAAKELSKIEFYSPSTIAMYLKKRERIVYGWVVSYYD